MTADFPTIGLYRQRLDDIRDWYTHLPETMLTIASQPLSLAPTRGTTTRIPGGDALAMLGPWAPDADHGDDLPHPAQIIREWAHTIHDAHGNVPPAHGTWAAHWRFLRDQVPWILESPWAQDWQQDVDALWWRLARLTGNAPVEKTEDVQRRLADYGPLLPDTARLTLPQADECWPGIRNRVDQDRWKERARARKEGRPAQYRCDPDEKRRYLVADLREHYGATRGAEMRDTA